MRSGGRSPARLAFDVAKGAFPRAFLEAHGEEMAAAFERERVLVLAARGRIASLTYSLRACADAVRQGLVERRRTVPPPGHGSGRAPRHGRAGTGLWADLRYALRGLRRTPGFTLTAIAVLALGIGANTTVFSALRVVILAPAPYADADRLVFADLTQEHVARGETRFTSWSYPKFERLVEMSDRRIDPVIGYTNRVATLTGEGSPTERIGLEAVSPGYFGLLGVTPMLGRAFGPEEGRLAEPALVTILSHALWRSRFGGDPDVVGTQLTLGGNRFQVVGVAPAWFRGLTGNAQLWVPLTSVEPAVGYALAVPRNHWFHVIGRLEPDATPPEARAQMRALGSALAEAYPSSDPQTVWSADARMFRDVRVNAGARAAVILLAAAALVVLLAACANLSGLLIARSKRTAKAGAVRIALGASRWRIVRASFVESVLLAGSGGACGVVLALWGTRALRAAWPDTFVASARGELQVADLAGLVLDPVVLAFATSATVVTAIVFGAAPALRLSRTPVSPTLKDGSGITRPDRTRLGFDGRSALVGAQVALALVLLVGTGLIGSSIARLVRVDEGFEADGVLTFRYAVPPTSAWSDRPAALQDAMLEGITGLPSVLAVGAGTQPLGGRWASTRLDAIEGGLPIPEDNGVQIGVHSVSDGYFEALGIPLLSGRTFDERDGTDPSPTTVISETAARTLFGDADPLGKGISLGFADPAKERFAEIVGVVGDVLYTPPDGERLPETYFSDREFGAPIATVLVRSSAEPTALIPAIRSLVSRLDPTVAVYGVTTMEEVVSASVGDRRVVLRLLELFALVALLLAATGTWGIVAVSVAERRRELGLRMALGAASGRVVGLMVVKSVRAAAIGVVAGLAAATAGSTLVESFLWQTRATDPAVFAGGALLLVGVVLLASWIPARRVLAMDPAETLRSE